MDLTTFDLNLLKTLMVLLQEKNTNRAAERLNKTQPAVSRTLAKIREHFDDPLFIRHSRGLKLTPKAEALAVSLPILFDSLQATLSGEPFLPEKQSGLMKIAMNGFIIETYGYQICEAINNMSPNVDIELHSYSAKSTAELIAGEVDFAISYYPLNISKELRQVPIGLLEFQLICRSEHPLAMQSITINEMLDVDLAGLIVPEFNDKAMLVQHMLGDGVDIKPKFRCQQVNPILKKISDSDILFIAPKCLLDYLDNRKYTYVSVIDKMKRNEMKISLIYNSRYMRSEKYMWIEKLVSRIIPSKISS